MKSWSSHAILAARRKFHDVGCRLVMARIERFIIVQSIAVLSRIGLVQVHPSPM